MKTQTITLKSLGLTGPQYIAHLEKKGYQVSSYAKDMAKSIPASKKGTTYEIAIIKASELSQEYSTTKDIRDEAQKRGYVTPPAEISFLLREHFSDEDIEAMGLWWIVAMHEPIEGSDGDPRLLAADRDVGGRWLDAYFDRPDDRWIREGGLAFVVSQVSPENSEPVDSSEPSDLALCIARVKEAGYRIIKEV